MIDYSIEIENLNLLQQYLTTELPAKIDKESNKLLKSIGKMVVTKSKAFAPYRTGKLERSITFRIDKTVGGQSLTVYVPMSSRAGNYAGYMHEGYYKLGELSRLKSGAGRKFIERAIKLYKSKVIKMYNQMLEDIGKAETPKE